MPAIISSFSLSESFEGSNRSSIIADIGTLKSESGSEPCMLPIVSLDVSIISPDSSAGSNELSIIADVGMLKSKNR